MLDPTQLATLRSPQQLVANTAVTAAAAAPTLSAPCCRASAGLTSSAIDYACNSLGSCMFPGEACKEAGGAVVRGQGLLLQLGHGGQRGCHQVRQEVGARQRCRRSLNHLSHQSIHSSSNSSVAYVVLGTGSREDKAVLTTYASHHPCLVCITTVLPRVLHRSDSNVLCRCSRHRPVRLERLSTLGAGVLHGCVPRPHARSSGADSEGAFWRSDCSAGSQPALLGALVVECSWSQGMFSRNIDWTMGGPRG